MGNFKFDEWKHINVDELKDCSGLNILMGFVRLPGRLLVKHFSYALISEKIS